MATGRTFHKSTMQLKSENLKTSVLKRPLACMASEFLISYLYDLKLTYDRTSKSICPMRHLKKKHKSKASLLNINFPFKEGTRTINEVLEDTKKHRWRQSNFSLAIQIAKVTELFGKELARKWANETTILLSLQSNVGEIKR